MFFAPLLMVYIILSFFVLQECVVMFMTSTIEENIWVVLIFHSDDFYNRNLFLTAKLLDIS